MNTKHLVLYADDDADDRLLLSDTLQSVAPDFSVETLENGFEAINYLQHRTPPMPCLLILDLNMPGISGKEVMYKLKSDERFQKLPIVVFTTSSNPADREECRKFGVDMLTKPLDLNEYEIAANRLLTYCQAH